MSYKPDSEINLIVRNNIKNSTTEAFVIPVMTTTERNALSPVIGAMLFNSTTTYVEVYNGSSWDQLAKV